MHKSRGGPSAQLLPLRAAVEHGPATNEGGLCVARVMGGLGGLSEGYRSMCIARSSRSSMRSTWRSSVYVCAVLGRKRRADMLRAIRGILCPECTRKASVAEAVGAGTA